ncbi:MAG: HEAT repeat domain-containing protein [Planctomycetes bacterium]|nr:HEAT repeat domain-containing protein [Planctomycetota bacterium]
MHRFCLRSLLFLFLCAAPAMAQDGVTAWVNELLRNKDDAEVALIEKIAASRTREGAEGLCKAFDAVGSLLMRREIVRGLAQWAAVPDGEQPAMQKLADVAGMEDHEELRSEALTALGRSPVIGKNLLKLLVDSEAPDAVREPALAEHVKLAGADDAAWYRQIWNLKQEQRKDAKGNIAAPELPSIRLLAFQGLVPYLDEDELIETLKREINPKIRRAALATMQQRSMPKAADMAEWVLERVDFTGADRAEAARILVDRVGTKAVPKFLDLMKKRDVTPEDLRQEMADLIVGLGDEATDKRLAKMVGRGKPHEKVFLLRATAKNNDPKLLAAVRKQLGDDALEVRCAAAEAIGARRDRDALPALRELLAKSKDPDDLRIALEAITAIEGTTSAWLKELAGYCSHADREVRNAAIEVLGRARDKRQIDVLLAALDHEDWSTRFVAIDALLAMRHKQGVGKLIERLGKETGRMKRRIADVLWQLTAQPFEEDAAAWQGWWQQAGEKFEVVGEKELDKAEREREKRRLTARTVATAKFFGIKVESHRVIFVIDVSGSMIESMYGRFVGKRGAARIDVAKQELKQAIENLEPGALFNVYAFSSGVARWQKEGVGANTEQSRKDALEWVERLGATGATNLYDTMKMAFADKDVDTIFVMSDGEPTSGEVIDPYRIREDVAFWNQHRKIKIHTIAIGGNLEVLEWLAKDAGGTYLQMR